MSNIEYKEEFAPTTQTVTISTIATAAPVGREFNVLCHSKVAKQVKWRAVDDTGNSLPGTLWTHTETPVVDEYSTGTIKVPETDAGSISIQVVDVNGRFDGQTGDKKSITFSNWNDPANNKFSGAGIAIADKPVAHPNKGDGNYPDSTVVGCSIRVHDYDNNGIEGAEVQWSFTPELAEESITILDENKNKITKVRGSYRVLTGRKGVSKVWVSTSRTLCASLTADIPSAGEHTSGVGGYVPTYFVNPYDTKVNIIRKEVKGPVAEDGFVHVHDQLSIGLGIPSIAPHNTSRNNAFLYFEGQGETLLGEWEADKTPPSYALPVGSLFNKDEKENEVPHNLPILFIQTRSGEVYSTLPIAFGTRGKWENKPPTANQVNRRADFPNCHVVPDPGLNGWVTDDDNIDPEQGLVVELTDALPSDVDGGSYIYFNFYLNGFGRREEGYPEKSKKWTLPGAQGAQGSTQAIEVSSGPPYRVKLKPKYATGYGVGRRRPDLFYCDYYVVASKDDDAKKTGQWSSGWGYYRMNTAGD